MKIALYLATVFLVFQVKAEFEAADDTTAVTSDTTTVMNAGTTTVSESATTATTTGSVSTSAPCQDDPNTDCTQYKSLCQNAKYVPLMQKFCPKFCGYCGGGTTNIPSTCVDSSTNCKNWAANGYCTNSFYTCTQRKENCAKTCSLCAPDAC